MPLRLRRPGRPAKARLWDWEIRTMVSEDISHVLELWARNAREHFGPVLSYDRWGPGVPSPAAPGVEIATQTTDPRDALDSRLRLIAAARDEVVLLASTGVTLIGYVSAFVRPTSSSQLSLEGVVRDLFVDVPYRRQGAGDMLMRSAVEWLRDRDAETIRASVPSDWRPAQALLRRAGWDEDYITFSLYD